jgi:hypothetical protein
VAGGEGGCRGRAGKGSGGQWGNKTVVCVGSAALLLLLCRLLSPRCQAAARASWLPPRCRWPACLLCWAPAAAGQQLASCLLQAAAHACACCSPGGSAQSPGGRQ